MACNKNKNTFAKIKELAILHKTKNNVSVAIYQTGLGYNFCELSFALEKKLNIKEKILC